MFLYRNRWVPLVDALDSIGSCVRLPCCLFGLASSCNKLLQCLCIWIFVLSYEYSVLFSLDWLFLLVEFLGLEPGELCLVQYPMLCSFDYLRSVLLLLESLSLLEMFTLIYHLPGSSLGYSII